MVCPKDRADRREFRGPNGVRSRARCVAEVSPLCDTPGTDCRLSPFCRNGSNSPWPKAMPSALSLTVAWTTTAGALRCGSRTDGSRSGSIGKT
jgi:hypothetical protein